MRGFSPEEPKVLYESAYLAHRVSLLVTNRLYMRRIIRTDDAGRNAAALRSWL
jgi:hypothetical protein